MTVIKSIAKRVLQQLKKDHLFFIGTIIAPFIVIYFLKIFMNTMPAGFPVARYTLPIAAFVIFFFSFLLCALVLVQERTKGTLERMFINGATRVEIMCGYIFGYMLLATIISAIVLGATLIMFDLNFTWKTDLLLFIIMEILSLVSIMLGIFISTFARNESQLFPFIPLITLPSLFLSGLLVDVAKLPKWTQIISYCLPLYYANNAITAATKSPINYSDYFIAIGILSLFAAILIILSSYTFKEIDK